VNDVHFFELLSYYLNKLGSLRSLKATVIIQLSLSLADSRAAGFSAKNREPDIVCCLNVFDNKLPLTSADHRLLSAEVFKQINYLFLFLLKKFPFQNIHATEI